jgi:RNA polymerase sigma factor (sigma-70 family)
VNREKSNDPMKPAVPATATDAFVTTRWTQVVNARGDSPEARQALSELCATYYAPVVAFLRREGRDEDTARELAHEFFALVLEQPAFDRVDPQRGRFRSYLLGALKHFLANRCVHKLRDKRGAGAVHEPLALETDTSSVSGTAGATSPSPDAVFDREWAVSLLERAFAVLSQESEQAGARPEFQTLKPWLTGDGAGRPQAEVARELGLNVGALRVAIHRLRRRFREVVKAEIAQTVSEPADVADELRHLIAALSL